MFLQCFFIFLLLYCRVALDSWVVVATSQSHRLLDSDGGVTKRRRDVVVCFDAILTNLISQLETEASMAGFEPGPVLHGPDAEKPVLARERLEDVVCAQFPTDIVEPGMTRDV